MLNPQELIPFCSTDETRPSLRQPYTRGGYTYATDGRIAVRVPAIDGIPDRVPAIDGIPDVERAPDCEGVFRTLTPTDAPWQPIPTDLPELPDGHECPECNGRAEVRWSYRDKDGDKHERSFECPVCDGDGVIEGRPVPMPWQGLTLDARRVAKFAALPGPVEFQAPSDPYEPVRVRFNGGIGLFMPMTEVGGRA